MKNNTIDYVPAVKNLLDSVFDTYIDHEGRTETQLKKKPVSYELLESENDFVLNVHASGYSKGDFEVKVEANKLIISSMVKKELKEGYKLLRSNIVKGDIYKVFELNDKVEAENISASYEQGVLTLTLPKSKKEIKKTITVL